MDVKTGFFYLFSLVLLFSAFRVVTARNTVHAVLFLMLAFSQASGLWLLLQAEFVAIVLVLVYLGAVMVMFLFVVMMLNLKIVTGKRPGFWRNTPVALLVGAVIALEMGGLLMGGFRDDVQISSRAVAVAAAAGSSNTAEVGKLLYTDYVYPIQIAAVILLVGMVAAIALALLRRTDSREIDPALQVAVKPSDRLVLKRVAVVRPAEESPAAPMPHDVTAEAMPTAEEKKS